MTGKFSEFDPRRCAHYARFFQHLNVTQANAIFWTLFTSVLILMWTSSMYYHKNAALVAAEKLLADELTPSLKVHNRRLRLKWLAIVSLCAALSMLFTAAECFAAFNIQYCDGEDLMMLYWGFWSILSVGSTIAILGVMLHFWIVLGNVETPSWAVALGTPVLVFAALGFVVRAIWRRRKPNRQDEESGGEKSEREKADVEKYAVGRSLSQAPTIFQSPTMEIESEREEPRPKAEPEPESEEWSPQPDSESQRKEQSPQTQRPPLNKTDLHLTRYFRDLPAVLHEAYGPERQETNQPQSPSHRLPPRCRSHH